MIISKVIRDNRRHITRADYNDIKPLLGSENIELPKVDTLQARALRRLFSNTISHRDFDFSTRSMRLGSSIGILRDKGWTVVNHDERRLTNDVVPRFATFTNYELFAEFTPELMVRIKAFCSAVDEFESKAKAVAAAKARNNQQILGITYE